MYEFMHNNKYLPLCFEAKKVALEEDTFSWSNHQTLWSIRQPRCPCQCHPRWTRLASHSALLTRSEWTAMPHILTMSISQLQCWLRQILPALMWQVKGQWVASQLPSALRNKLDNIRHPIPSQHACRPQVSKQDNYKLPRRITSFSSFWKVNNELRCSLSLLFPYFL